MDHIARRKPGSSGVWGLELGRRLERLVVAELSQLLPAPIEPAPTTLDALPTATSGGDNVARPYADMTADATPVDDSERDRPTAVGDILNCS
jgi:hypothetical protein